MTLDHILVIIPVRNEEMTIASVIHVLQSYGLHRIRVVDNGSTDGSALMAKVAGAEVVYEPIAGYGRACWTGLQNVPDAVEWILFCDGDGSDDLNQLPEFFAQCDQADFVLGNRRATAEGAANLTPVQQFGNELATRLIHAGWGYRYHDLGPLRLIRQEALARMGMGDRGFGWTVEMQVRAVEENLRIIELPVMYSPRQGGQSKISGTWVGSYRAGTAILATLGGLYWRKWGKLWEISEAVRSNNVRLVFSSLFLIAGTAIVMPYGDFRAAAPQFWWGVWVMAMGFVGSWTVRSVTPIWFWSVAILTRSLLLPMYPGDDVWRYLWEGYIQTLGFSPYEFAPTALELVPYRTVWWTQINNETVTAIYPPITELGFRLLAMIAPSVLCFKVAFVGADLAVCWLLRRQFGDRQSLLYAWNPLVIYAFAGGAHYDSWFLLPLVLAWLAFDSTSRRVRSLTSAVFLGLSIAVKWMSLPILFFLTLQGWRQNDGRKNWGRAIAVVTCGVMPFLLTALPFCSENKCPLIPTGSVFVSYGRSAEFVPYFLGGVWEFSRSVNWIYLVPLGFFTTALLLRSVTKRKSTFLQFAEPYFLGLLLVSPIVHAWYFTWLIPFAVASRNWGTQIVSLSAFFYFVLPYRQAGGNSDWLLPLGDRLWLWMPLVMGWIVNYCRTKELTKELTKNENY
jgi:glycosyltransferase involved in cell wall biosynthesis